MNFSKRAVWLAVNSEHGDRLVEIAQEHLKLDNALSPRPHLVMNAAELKAYESIKERSLTRINELRMERNAIISRFVGH